MKIGDTVKLCTDTYQLDAFISGEHEDGRSIGYWLVDCPEMKMRGGIFCKESMLMDGKYYNLGTSESWIVEAASSLEQVTELVDNWMDDESGYDQQAYPEIEVALTADEITEQEWLKAASSNPVFDFLKDPEEDIYTLSDGKPFNDRRENTAR